MISALEALKRLQDGNQRFHSNVRSLEALMSQSRLGDLSRGQDPFAIVLGCSDSRVPAELIFDQGFGDLFVIRVAGNIVAPSQVGSIEFASARFRARLVVVLGHSRCGAVDATIEELQGRPSADSANLRSIVDRIQPAVAPLMETSVAQRADALMHAAVRANVRAAASHLRHGSPLLEKLIAEDGLLVVGAEYSLDTGVVDFFDGVPKSG
jgi:carbonic anhydrase